MKVYRISAQKAQVEKRHALRRSAVIITVALLVGVLAGGRQIFQEKDMSFLFVFVGFFGLILVFTIWRSLKQTTRFLAEAYSTFEIMADEQTLTKTQRNTPEVTLSRTEIRRIEELQGKGFRICTAERNRNIWVPCEVEGYEELKAEVLGLPGVEMTSKSAAWLRTYLAIAGLMLLIAISFLVSDKRIAAGTSLLLGAYMLFIPFWSYRNPNLTEKGKRQLLVVAFAGAFFLLRAIIVWRS